MEVVQQLSKKQYNILSELMHIAQKSDMQSLHGACIVQNGKIYSKGFNSYRCLVNGSYTGSTHAEISAIHQLLRRTPPKRAGSCKLSYH